MPSIVFNNLLFSILYYNNKKYWKIKKAVGCTESCTDVHLMYRGAIIKNIAHLRFLGLIM